MTEEEAYEEPVPFEFVFNAIEDIFMTIIVPSYKIMKKTEYIKYSGIVIAGLFMMKIVFFFISFACPTRDNPINAGKTRPVLIDA